jgi:alkanesulfonate monooxygenase SsuD/methylene tetrahydromethanopterin reductase-like flavin-dependent oxidoreductase (luciferase family)
MGYEAAAQTIQDRYLAKDYAGAAEAVPYEFIDETSLIGPVERIAERMQEYAKSGVTTLSITPGGFTLDDRRTMVRQAAEALDKSGVGD